MSKQKATTNRTITNLIVERLILASASMLTTGNFQFRAAVPNTQISGDSGPND